MNLNGGNNMKDNNISIGILFLFHLSGEDNILLDY